MFGFFKNIKNNKEKVIYDSSCVSTEVYDEICITEALFVEELITKKRKNKLVNKNSQQEQIQQQSPQEVSS